MTKEDAHRQEKYYLILSVLYDIDLNKTFKNKNNRTLSRVVLKHCCVSEQLCSRENTTKEHFHPIRKQDSVRICHVILFLNLIGAAGKSAVSPCF